MLKIFRSFRKKKEVQTPTLVQYWEFLLSIRKFQSLNDTYDNIARLHKSRFFVLHHEVYRDIDSLLDIALMEHDLGWKANYFVPNTPESMKHPPLKKIISLGHDVGLLYDMLGELSERYKDNPRELYQRAWAQFGEILRQNHALNIRSVAPYPHQDGIDNLLLWKHYDYQVQNVRCDSELDFRDDKVVCFCLQKGEIQYLKRDLYGNYHPQNPGKKISNLPDLGKRLKQGLLVPRMVLKIRWE